MKTATCKKISFWNQPCVPYPNAATRKQVLNKIIDRILTVVSCIGIVATVMFLFTLS